MVRKNYEENNALPIATRISLYKRMKKINDLRKNIREKVLGVGAGGEQDINEPKEKEENVSEAELPLEDGDNEKTKSADSSAIRVLESIRNVFLEKNIAGSIEVGINVTSLTSVTSKNTAVSCSVELDEGDGLKLSSEISKDLSTVEKMAVKAAIASIDGLKKRAAKFAAKPYKNSCSLTETLNISMPVLGLFDIYVEVSATVDSLLKS